MIEQKIDLPPIPKNLVEKANSLYLYLMNSNDTLGEQLGKVYQHLDELQPFIAQFMACKKGCSHCCNMDVQITALEAAYIHAHAGAPFPREGRLTTGHVTPCPFLEADGACGIYAARPIACRRYFAMGNPENCLPGRVQKHYGHAPNFGNPIFANIMGWIQHISIHHGMPIQDIRDFFPTDQA